MIIRCTTEILTSVTFPAGTASGDTVNVTIDIVNDTLIEGNEDLSITSPSSTSLIGFAMITTPLQVLLKIMMVLA